ncbi:MAG: peptidylprolyl isomerase [Campylobacterota bacterium]|nr:peptidylprolyl isomerase [Campylobacterota bacterium]
MKKLLLLIVSLVYLQGANQIAVLETTQGIIKIELRADLAPKTVENFTTHIKNGYYNGIIFHRIIKDFMVQGGDPTGTGRGGESIWGGKFKDEFNSKAMFNKIGILAMANAGPNTNGSQFFITTTKTPWLNGKHTIFGYLNDKESFKTLKKLNEIKTSGRYGGDKPLKEQSIIKAYLK